MRITILQRFLNLYAKLKSSTGLADMTPERAAELEKKLLELKEKPSQRIPYGVAEVLIEKHRHAPYALIRAIEDIHGIE